MKHSKLLFIIEILTTILFSEMIILCEAKPEYLTDDLDSESIVKNKDFENVRKIVVDQNDVTSKYINIQLAIDDAEIGSTIYIKSGTYFEILNIDKKINLVGENKDNTTICAYSKKNGYAIKISSPYVNLKGIGVINTGQGLYTTGIKIVASEVEIIDCKIYDTPVGIAVWSSGNTIYRCCFWRCEDEGIAFLGSPDSDCSNNVVSNCEFINNCDGIELQYSSDNIISYCSFTQNTHAGIDAIGSLNNGNTISNCSFSENKVFGIYYSRSSDLMINYCIVEENQIMFNNVEDTIINECDIESLYLVDSNVQVISCNNFKISQVKNINSECRMDNLQSDEEKIVEKNSIFYTILSFIRLRLSVLKDNFFNN